MAAFYLCICPRDGKYSRSIFLVISFTKHTSSFDEQRKANEKPIIMKSQELYEKKLGNADSFDYYNNLE